MYKPLAAILMLTICCSQVLAEETVPVKQAKREGIATCLRLVTAGANTVISGDDHSSIATWNLESPNKRMFNTQIMVNYSDGHAVTSLTVAPTSTNACDGTYTQVLTLPKSCESARRTHYKDWKDTTGTSELITMSTEGKTAILMPFLTGCTIVVTAVVYE